eukprot:scaffold652_cov188-Chaetoceros_neogracile.AAC.9
MKHLTTLWNYGRLAILGSWGVMYTELDSEHIGAFFDDHSVSFGSELADVLELDNKGLRQVQEVSLLWWKWNYLLRRMDEVRALLLT